VTSRVGAERDAWRSNAPFCCEHHCRDADLTAGVAFLLRPVLWRSEGVWFSFSAGRDSSTVMTPSFAHLLHGFGDDAADLSVVVGGNRADLRDHVALDVTMELFDFLDRGFHGAFNAGV